MQLVIQGQGINTQLSDWLALNLQSESFYLDRLSRVCLGLEDIRFSSSPYHLLTALHSQFPLDTQLN